MFGIIPDTPKVPNKYYCHYYYYYYYYYYFLHDRLTLLYVIYESFFCFFKKFIYFWLCWVFASVQGLSLAAASGGNSSSQCAGLSLSRALLLQSTGSRPAGSVIVAHGPSCSAACGIFPDQGSNPCALHWQADSQPLRHQGSPLLLFYEECGNYDCVLSLQL